MSEAVDNDKKPPAEAPAPAGPAIHVAPSPHSFSRSLTTRRMMLDVLIALVPVMGVAIKWFGWQALYQAGICVGGCILAEAVFTAMRGRCPLCAVKDLSAVVTGVILAMSLPWSAPWYVGVIGAAAAVGLGKIVFGGLGQNIFNPAMVGRAFVMICFAGAMAAGAYVKAAPADKASDQSASLTATDVTTSATPMEQMKKSGGHRTGIPEHDAAFDLGGLFLGRCNGSLGETCAWACLLGGLYLVLRRTAAWQIPAGAILAVAIIAGLKDMISPSDMTMLHHITGGALLFGAFFIATDPVSSPITPRGRLIFGIGVGAMVMLFRLMSTFPEGVMFAVLLMNAVVPLINRWTIPIPVGGPVPQRK